MENRLLAGKKAISDVKRRFRFFALGIQMLGIAVWYGLVQACLSVRNVPMGTFQMCRDGC